MADMQELIARLEAGEVGPDLDASICVLLQYGGPNSNGATNVRTDGDWEGDLLFEHGSDECCNPIPAVTTSLDAALALAERVLPGWVWMVESHRDGRATAWLSEFNAYGEGEQVLGNSPTLALCIAILKAKAQGEGG